MTTAQPIHQVARIHDRAELARFLDPERDSYMVGDLDEPYWSQARFYGAYRDQTLIAVVNRYDPIDPPPIISAGDADGVEAIYAHLARPGPDHAPRVFYHAPEDHLERLQRWYTIDPAEHMAMWRMTCAPGQLHAPRTVDGRLIRLTGADLPAVRAALPAPDHLNREWVFYAAQVAGEWAALAGTHIVSPVISVGVIGWVFTRPEYRGRGLAAACTGAVARALLDEGLALLALNVRQDNPAAIRAYERCGFAIHGPLWEGEAAVRASISPQTGG